MLENLMNNRFVKVRHALEQMDIESDWTAYVIKLSKMADDRRIIAIKTHQIKATVNDNKFWASCDKYQHMLKEILKALKVFDGAKLAMET